MKNKKKKNKKYPIKAMRIKPATWEKMKQAKGTGKSWDRWLDEKAEADLLTKF